MGKQFLYARGRKLQFCILFTSLQAFMLMGYDQGLFSSIVSDPDFLNVIAHPNAVNLGVVVASYNLGCFAGAIFAFVFAEKLGRRRSMWVAMGFIIVGAIIQCSAFSRAQLVAGRVICGVGTGIETSTVPMYQSELSHAKSRGRLVSCEALFVGVGITIAYWFDFGMVYVNSPASWRLPVAFQCVFALITVVMLFGVPESPRYLYKEGRNQEALEVLCAVWDKEPSHPDIQREQNDILGALALEMEHGEYQWSQIFKKDRVHTGKRVFLSWVINTINQLCGINLVVYYAPTVLRINVGLTGELPQVLGGVIQMMFVIGSLVPAFCADKYGRRKPLMWGCFGMAISMMLIAVTLSVPNDSHASIAAVAFFFTYMLIFGSTVNCLTWVMGPEIMPLHVRAKGSGLAISAIWIWNFTVVMITPVIITKLQWKAYLIFMCLNASFIPILYFFFPETANLTLEEIDWLFTEGHPAWKAHKELLLFKEQRGLVTLIPQKDDSSGSVSVVQLDRVDVEKQM